MYLCLDNRLLCRLFLNEAGCCIRAPITDIRLCVSSHVCPLYPLAAPSPQVDPSVSLADSGSESELETDMFSRIVLGDGCRIVLVLLKELTSDHIAACVAAEDMEAMLVALLPPPLPAAQEVDLGLCSLLSCLRLSLPAYGVTPPALQCTHTSCHVIRCFFLTQKPTFTLNGN